MANVRSCVSYLIVLIFCPGVIEKDIYGREIKGHYNRNYYEPNANNTTLRFVSMIFRHGDRTLNDESEAIYPNNPYKNHSYYPYNNGQLTNEGKRKSFQLGQMLRTIYGNFLGNVYYPPNVYARSTIAPRAKMTLQLILAALYPPINEQKWDQNLKWQPVDIIYTRASEDGLLFPYVCKEYEQAYVDILKNETVIEESKKYRGLMKELSEPVGQNITTVFHLFTLYHILYILSSMNLTLPVWTHNKFPNGELLNATFFQYKLYNYNEKLIKLNGGKWLYKIIEDMTGVVNGTLVDRKINIFSAHDVNVVAILYALGIFNNFFPMFTSGVIIELHEKEGEFYVLVLYYFGVPRILKPMQIPDCDLFCPLEKFITLKRSVTTTHENMNCPLDISPL